MSETPRPPVAGTDEQRNAERDPRRLGYELGRIFAEPTTSEELITVAVAHCRELLNAEGTAVLMFCDPKQNELYFPYRADADPAVAERLQSSRFSVDRGIAGSVIRTRRSERVDDPRSDPRFFDGVDECTGRATRALLCAPLIFRHDVLGVIEVINPRGRTVFDDRDLSLLDAIAESLAAAIVRLRGGTWDEPGPAAHVFRKEGDIWTVAFEGKVCRLKDTKGLRYVALLLRHPDQEIHSIDVEAGLQSDPSTNARARAVATEAGLHVGPLGDAGDTLDARARVEYRQRLAELREEIEEAERLNDAGRLAQAREELGDIEEQLAGAFGLGGDRSRPTASPAERARLNISRAVKAALLSLGQHHPPLRKYLQRTIKTGTFCCYTPDPRARIDWQF